MFHYVGIFNLLINNRDKNAHFSDLLKKYPSVGSRKFVYLAH